MEPTAAGRPRPLHHHHHHHPTLRPKTETEVVPEIEIAIETDRETEIGTKEGIKTKRRKNTSGDRGQDQRAVTPFLVPIDEPVGPGKAVQIHPYSHSLFVVESASV